MADSSQKPFSFFEFNSDQKKTAAEPVNMVEFQSGDIYLEKRYHDLDEEIYRIQRSTRTTLPLFIPVHNAIRTRLKWYYRWHVNRFSPIVHLLTLGVYILGSILMIGWGATGLPKYSKASSSQTWSVNNWQNWQLDDLQISEEGSLILANSDEALPLPADELGPVSEPVPVPEEAGSDSDTVPEETETPSEVLGVATRLLAQTEEPTNPEVTPTKPVGETQEADIEPGESAESSESELNGESGEEAVPAEEVLPEETVLEQLPYKSQGIATINFTAPNSEVVDWLSFSANETLNGQKIAKSFSTDNIIWENSIELLPNSEKIYIKLVFSTEDVQVTPILNSFSVNYSRQPYRPAALSPIHGDPITDLTPTLKASDYADPDNDAFQGAQWQIAKGENNFNQPMIDEINQSTSFAIKNKLENGGYYWRVRYQDSTGAWSLWSRDAAFVIGEIPKDIAEKRTEKSKTFAGENGSFSVKAYTNPIHYKENYNNSNEQWKDINSFHTTETEKYVYYDQMPIKVKVYKDRIGYEIESRKTGTKYSVELQSIDGAAAQIDTISQWQQNISNRQTGFLESFINKAIAAEDMGLTQVDPLEFNVEVNEIGVRLWKTIQGEEAPRNFEWKVAKTGSGNDLKFREDPEAFEIDNIDKKIEIQTEKIGTGNSFTWKETAPQTNLKIDTDVTYYSGVGDGWVEDYYDDDTNFATIRTDMTGTGYDYTSSYAEVESYWGGFTYGGGDGIAYISRAFLPFDTSALPDDATIDAATLGIYVTSFTDNGETIYATSDTTQASPTELDSSDFGSIGSAEELFSSITTSQYNEVEFTNLAFISLDGYTLIGLQTEADINDAPSVGIEENITFSTSEETGTGQDPYLAITYTPAGSAPTVTTQAVSSIAATTATGNGTITDLGGGTISDCGVKYGLTETDTWSQSSLDCSGAAPVVFTASMASLTPNTTYHVRAYATNETDTAYGSWVTATTLANVPSAPTVDTPTASSLKVTINANSNPASTEFAIYNETLTKYVGADGVADEAAEVWQTRATWGGDSGIVNTGLSALTEYTYKVKARNSDNTPTDLSAGASETTLGAISITGTCKKYDESTNCADSETIKVAYNAVLQAQTATTSTGAFTVNMASAPNSGDVITVFVDGVADFLEAIAVTKYDGTGNITGVLLYEDHLTIGSDDNASLTNTNLSQYDNSVSTDEDIFFDVDTGNLITDDTAQSAQEELFIVTGNTLTPGGNITTHDLDLNGTLVPEANTVNVAGSLDFTGGTFTAGASTVNINGAEAGQTITTNNQSFFNLIIAGQAGGGEAAEITAFPTSVIDDGSGQGTVNMYWDNPEYAVSDNNAYAVYSDCGPMGYPTGLLMATGFDFSSIPDGSVVNGIKVTVGRYGDTTGSAELPKDYDVSLTAGGSPLSGDNKADLVNYWEETETAKEYGGASDLWNVTDWDPETEGYWPINFIKGDHGDFGVQVAAAITGGGCFSYGNCIANVDYIKMTVNYTESGAAADWTLSGNLTTTGTLTMTSGTLTAGANNVTTVHYSQGGGVFSAPTSANAMNVSGNFAHTSGTFTAPASSTVNLTGAGGSTQAISGDTTFVNLSATASAARTITFTSESTTTVTGTWTVDGDLGSVITLGRSGGVDPAQWNIDPTAWAVDYVSVSNSENQAVAYINPTNSTDGGNNDMWFEPTIAVSGSCKQYNETDNCADSETVKVAINGVLSEDTGTTSSGTWSINVSDAMVAGDVITVFVDGVADALEANAVTKYDGTGDITGILLYEDHLTVGSADNQDLSNTNLSQYDNSVSGDEDIFFDVDAGNLIVDDTAQSTQEKLFIISSNTLTPGGNITTHDLDLNGTLVPEANTINVAGSLDFTSGTFTKGTSTVNFNGNTAGETITSDSEEFYNLTVAGESGEVEDTLTVYPDPESADPQTSVDGYLQAQSGASWDAAHDAFLASAMSISAESWVVAGATYWSANPIWSTTRSIFTFDLSELPVGAEPTSATFSIFGQSKADMFNRTPNINIYSTSPTSKSTLVNSDIDNLGGAGNEYSDTPIAYADWLIDGYNNFNLNAAGLAAIVPGEVVAIGARNQNYDVADSAPLNCGASGCTLSGYFADQAGTDKDPKLVVNYTTGGMVADWTLQDALTVSNTMTVTSGTLDAGANTVTTKDYTQGGGVLEAPSTTMNVSGNFANNGGTFTHNNGEVILDGAAASTQTLSGDTNFFDLTATATDGDRTINFASESTQTVSDTWTVDGTENGADDHVITLGRDGGIDPAQWNINPSSWVVDTVSVSNSENKAVAYINPTNSTDGGNNDMWFEPTTTISGSCKKYDEATNCADSETVKVAINGSLSEDTGTTSSGTWSINISDVMVEGDVITVFVDGVADSLEANAVTKYDGTGDITGVLLYEDHLTIGSADNQDLSNTNLSQYDNSVSSDEDIFFDVDAGNLIVDDTAQSTQEKLFILASNTLTPGGNITTHDLDLNGTLVPEANTINVAGSWDATGGTFTAGTSTVNFNGTTAGETITTNDQSFYHMTIAGGDGTPTSQAQSAGTTASIATCGDAYAAWTNLANATGASDSVYAEVALPYDEGSECLKFTNYGFNIPAGATIDGITISMNKSQSVFSWVDDEYVYLVYGDTIQSGWDNKAADTIWDGEYVYGGAADLWNSSGINVAGINANDFGVVISGYNMSTWENPWEEIAYLDNATITIDYTPAASDWTLQDHLHVANTMTVSSGTLTAGANTINTIHFVQGGGIFNASSGITNVSGDFSRSAGTFVHSSGVVNLTGAGGTTQTISGDTTFNNLSATAASARTINFASESTQTVLGTWTVDGDLGSVITLGRSGGVDPAQWNIDPTAWAVDYVSVSNSGNLAATKINPANSTDGGNNTNWFLSVPIAPDGVTLDTPAADGFTVHWNDNSSDETNFNVYISTLANVDCSLATYGAVPDYEPVAGATSQAVSGKSVNTQYCAKVTAENGDGESTAAYAAAPLYTLANVPLAPTVDTPTSSSLKVTINVNSNPASTEFAIYNETATQYVQADGTLGAGEVWQDYATWGGAAGIVNTGLTSSTLYSYTVKARNGDNVATAMSAAGSETTSVAGVTVAGTVYTAEDKLTNIGADKTIGVSVNGGVKQTVETTAGGAFSLTDVMGLDANIPFVLFIDSETGLEANLISKAADSSTEISGLELYTNKITLRTESASLSNADIKTTLACSDCGSDLHYTNPTGSKINFDEAYELWIDSGKTYIPGAEIGTAGDVDINGTLNQEANYLTMTGSLDATGGTLSHTTSTTTFSNATDPQVITLDGENLGNVVFSNGGTRRPSGTLDINGTFTQSGGTLDLATNNPNWSIADDIAFASGSISKGSGTLTMDGDLTYMAAAGINPGAVAVGASPDTVTLVSNVSYDSLTINAGDILVTDGYDIDVAGDITIHGTLNATSGTGGDSTINVGGSWSCPDGTFTKGLSTVIFDGNTAGETITTNNQEFYNVTVAGSDASGDTGFVIAGTGAENTSGGAYSWTDYTNVTADDAAYVHHVEEEPGGAVTYYIEATNFDFSSIPAGATINGIEVNVERYKLLENAATDVYDGSVYLNAGGEDKGEPMVTWPDVATIKTYGGAADLWNAEPISLEDVQNSSFGVLFQATSVGEPGGGMAHAYVDYIAMKVYYTASVSDWTLQDDLTVTNTLTMTSGTLTSGANDITTKDYTQDGGELSAPTSANAMNVSGDFANNGGTFTAPALSTVNLIGAGGSTQTISGDTTFVNLSATAAAARTITFTAGTTQTVTGTWTATGSSGQLLTLNSSAASAWSIDPTAWNVDYVNPVYSTNLAAAKINPTHYTDGGNNINWFPALPTAPDGVTLDTPATDGFTVHWNDNSSDETGFKVYISTVANADCSLATYGGVPDYTPGAGVESQAVSGKDVNSQYCAKVTAYNGDGDSSAAYAATALYTLANVPSAPTVSTPTSSSLKVIINVNSNPASTEFAIYNETALQWVKTDGTMQAGESWDSYTNFGGASGVVNTGLTQNTSYTYKVKARNGDNVETALSAGTSESTLDVVPTAPSNLAIANLTATTFNTTWDDNSSNETGFKLYISTSANADCSLATYPGSPDYTPAANIELQAVAAKSINTQYCAKIVATNAIGDSSVAYSSPKYTLANIPSAPTVNVTSATSLTVVINQNSNPVATQYAVYNETLTQWVQADGTSGAGEVWQDYATWGGASGITNTGLVTGVAYTYKVKARNGENVETALSAGASATPADSGSVSVNAPAAPSSVAITNLGTNSFLIQWTDESSDETGFKVYVGPGTNCMGSVYSLVGTASVNASSFAINNKTPNTAYCARVSAINSGGESSGVNSSSRYTLAQDPTIGGISGWDGSYFLNLRIDVKDNPDATQYRIMSGSGGANNILYDWASLSGNETLTQDTLSCNQSYYYSIKARNGENIETLTDTALLKTAPCPPTNLGISGLSDAMAVGNWVGSGEGVPTFIISFGTDLNATNGGVLYVINLNEVTFNNLRAQTNYYFKVRESNENGASAWSEIKGFTTNTTPPLTNEEDDVFGGGLTKVFPRITKVLDLKIDQTKAARANIALVATTAAVLMAPILINSLPFLFNLWPQLELWFAQLMQFLGIRRRRKPWGVVYNSQTGRPISLARVMIYDQESDKLLETVVTDKQGRFGFLAKKGSFYLMVRKNGFDFPAKTKISFYENSYYGGQIMISSATEAVILNIPIVPQVQSKSINLMIATIRFLHFLDKLRRPLMAVGVLLTVILLISSFTTFYIASFVVYILMILLEILRNRGIRPYGLVTDREGRPIQLAIVRVFEAKNDRLIVTDVTDSEGRYRFLIQPGTYYLVATKQGYHEYRSKDRYFSKEESLVAANIELNKPV